MADVELLPLPRCDVDVTVSYSRATLQAYARANVAHATAPLQAKVEALRAEVAEWKRVAAAQAELHDEAEARADKLAEALSLIESAKERGFGIDYARGVAQSVLLRDQEEGRG